MEQKFNRLLIAAYRLPFKFIKTQSGINAVQNSGGLVSAILALSQKFKANSNNTQKIVWAGIDDEIPQDFDLKSFENDDFDILPVHIPPKINDLYYGGFCNDLLWPLFHYFPTYTVFNPNYYEAFVDANQRFCDEIVKEIKPGDFIWIHDYQLLLLPEMIRAKVPDATIGFFLHIPFPSFEIFRLMPRNWREAIVKGMLGADIVGFHTHDYVQHFIKSVKRTTGYECKQNIIFTHNKLVKADAFPIGIDYDKFRNACLDKEVIEEKISISKILNNCKLIFSVDRLDYSKGLVLRLKGFELFLEMYPLWHEKVIFNMLVVPSRDNIEKYKDMKKEIESIIGRINGKYSTLAWRPIIYQYKSVSFNELVALYDLSNVGLITPLRDGMNLVAKEYVTCQLENVGVLILSEMAGAAAELNEAIIINPSDNLEVADAIYKALEMDEDEKHFRNARMRNRISSYNVFTWALDFFNQTFEIKKQQNIMSVKFINNTIIENIVFNYRSARRRILFLDYDGTLVSFTKYPELATIGLDTKNIISNLTKDSKNHVVIISGRDKDFLEKQFHDVNVTLVAEHGFFVKKMGKNWESTIVPNSSWKDSVMPILKEYVNRCNGTFIEEKTGSLAWHYRNADADFAQLRLHELRDELAEIIRHKTDFEILEGNKVLEIKSGKYDKGQAATSILQDITYDFILAVGDDKTDEFLFKVMPEFAFTIRIGMSPSIAKYNIADSESFLQLLNTMVD